MTSMLQKTIHEAFSAIASAVPASVALETATEQMTYAQLARRSGQIARGLRARGVDRGARVGIYAQRGMDAIAAMLGILEAGAAFVPFDPAYPANLLKFVYEDCAPAQMLVQSSLLEPGSTPFWSGAVLDIHTAFADTVDDASPLPAVDREDPALSLIHI